MNRPTDPRIELAALRAQYEAATAGLHPETIQALDELNANIVDLAIRYGDATALAPQTVAQLLADSLSYLQRTDTAQRLQAAAEIGGAIQAKRKRRESIQDDQILAALDFEILALSRWRDALTVGTDKKQQPGRQHTEAEQH